VSEPVIHLAILDDHQIVIDGLKLLLQANPELHIAAEATSAEEMLEQLTVKKIDVILTDITIPHGMGGYEFSMKVKQEFPHIKILPLSMSEEGSMITKMIEVVKVDGYIPKSAGYQELLTAIKAISSGKQYFSTDALQQYEIYKNIKTENLHLNLSGFFIYMRDAFHHSFEGASM
jgi:DNA-binding NarL/FixJ family response regulator